MKITKIKIKNLFGIKEYEADNKSIELVGENGVGKTSVIDAIRYALSNKSGRDYIVRNGATEGEVLIETDAGLSINRKSRKGKADYKSIKKNGTEISSPETFLKDIFTELQLNPVEFLQMDKKKQNAIILDMIEFNWDLNWIKEQFGEVVPDINYEQNILHVLNDIQSEKGYYFKTRQDINRDIRNKKAFIEDIAQTIPSNYNSKKWEEANLSNIYKEIEAIRHKNDTIEKGKRLLENRDNKIRKFQADKEISISTLKREIDCNKNRLEKDIMKLQEQIKSYKIEIEGLEDKKQNRLEVIQQTYKANIASYDAEVREYEEYVNMEPIDITNLLEKARTAEEMKGHLNEFKRMLDLQNEVEELTDKSITLTNKIEKARTLPGEILGNSTIPINGLMVEDGIPLINGLPVSNLSEGEKFDLCIDVAVQKPSGLQIILIDGVEKLSMDNREKLYTKCKTKGIQFIATRTTDDKSLNVIEL